MAIDHAQQEGRGASGGAGGQPQGKAEGLQPRPKSKCRRRLTRSRGRPPSGCGNSSMSARTSSASMRRHSPRRCTGPVSTLSRPAISPVPRSRTRPRGRLSSWPATCSSLTATVRRACRRRRAAARRTTGLGGGRRMRKNRSRRLRYIHGRRASRPAVPRSQPMCPWWTISKPSLRILELPSG
jgi:hypothetical protein